MHHVHRGDLCRANLAHQEHGPLGLGGKVQLLGADVDVAQQDVVRDDALDKGGLVVLLLVVSFGAVQGHGDHGADELGLLVAALDEGGVVKVGAAADQGLKALVPVDHHGRLVDVQGGSGALPFFADPGQLITGHHSTLVVNDADDPVRTLLHLEHNTLKNSAGHIPFPPLISAENGNRGTFDTRKFKIPINAS